MLFTDDISVVTGAILTYAMTNFGWVFMLSTLGFVTFMVYPAFSCHGVGADHRTSSPWATAW